MTSAPCDAVLRRAASTVRSGGVIAYPTEYCYGLGCDPGQIPAIQAILSLKQRPRSQGLLLIAAGIDQLKGWIDLSVPAIRKRVEGSWPGPITWLVPPGPRASSWLRGNHSSLAVRVTAHVPAARLCRYIGMPLVSTSANRSGLPELRTAESVRMVLPAVDYIVPGKVGDLGAPTAIRDAVTGKTIRGPA